MRDLCYVQRKMLKISFRIFFPDTSSVLKIIFDYKIIKFKKDSVRITRGYKLCFIDIIPNNALTVFYIFWDLMFEETNTKKIMKNANAENFENDMEKLQESLNKVVLI